MTSTSSSGLGSGSGSGSGSASHLALSAGDVPSGMTISRGDGLSFAAMMIAPAIIALPIAAVGRRVVFPIGR